MAEANSTNINLADELSAVINPVFKIKALLQGASLLMNEAEHCFDEDGNLWSAREIVDQAWLACDEIFSDRQSRLLSRLKEIDTSPSFSKEPGHA